MIRVLHAIFIFKLITLFWGKKKKNFFENQTQDLLLTKTGALAPQYSGVSPDLEVWALVQWRYLFVIFPSVA